MEKTTSYPFYIKISCVLISLILLICIGIIGESIIVPLFLAMLISTLLIPLSVFMERKFHFSRSLAAISSTLLFLAVVVGILFLVGAQMSRLTQEWPAFEEQLVGGVHSIQLWVQDTFGIQQSKQLDFITEHASASLSTGTDLLAKTLSSISTMLMYLVFTVIYTIFLLIYRRHLVRFLVICFKHKQKNTVVKIIVEIQTMVKKYLIGLLLQMILVTIMTFIAYTVLGIKYNFMLAIITGLLNVLPYIGIFMAMLIGVLITFATTSASHVVLVLIALVIIHAIDGNIIMPKIVGSKVKVNSLVVVIGLVIGHMMWGISGMLLAIPTLAIAKIVFDRVDGMRAWGFLLGEEENENPMLNFSIAKMLKGKHKFPDKDDVN